MACTAALSLQKETGFLIETRFLENSRPEGCKESEKCPVVRSTFRQGAITIFTIVARIDKRFSWSAKVIWISTPVPAVPGWARLVERPKDWEFFGYREYGRSAPGYVPSPFV
jgi:hypothetical protein